MVSPLKDKWVVITRPKHQADTLRLKLEAAGANVILFPLLEISLPDSISLAKKQLAQIEQYSLAIFTSANAVDYSFKWLDKSKLTSLRIAAIGKKTARVLEDSYGIKVDYFPAKGFNSEALLAMPEIKNYNDGKTIVILRGQNGRELLKEKLEGQGAKVDYIDVYKREFPQQNLESLKQKFEQAQLDIILITSGTSLKNLFEFSLDNEWLEKTNLLMGSERIKTQLENTYKFQGSVLSASDPSDETLYQALLKWGSSSING